MEPVEQAHDQARLKTHDFYIHQTDQDKTTVPNAPVVLLLLHYSIQYIIFAHYLPTCLSVSSIIFVVSWTAIKYRYMEIPGEDWYVLKQPLRIYRSHFENGRPGIINQYMIRVPQFGDAGANMRLNKDSRPCNGSFHQRIHPYLLLALLLCWTRFSIRSSHAKNSTPNRGISVLDYRGGWSHLPIRLFALLSWHRSNRRVIWDESELIVEVYWNRGNTLRQ